jgi:hypothetical protein
MDLGIWLIIGLLKLVETLQLMVKYLHTIAQQISLNLLVVAVALPASLQAPVSASAAQGQAVQEL